ncbi:MAG: hypothetical protein M0Z64_07490 [Nitrospiraceae bacterium]|nr:hypothetical protein [Nitrospiraceae bacterium]
MKRGHFLLNVIFIAIAGFLGFKLYDSLSRPPDIPSWAVHGQASSDKEEVQANVGVDEKSDFQTIVQKDIFRPDRKEPEDILRPSPPSLSPPPRLVGIAIAGNESRAFLEDPITKAVKVCRIKDSIAGFTVHKIQEDRVVLLRGDERVEVKIRETKTIEVPGKISPYIPTPP